MRLATGLLIICSFALSGCDKSSSGESQPATQMRAEPAGVGQAVSGGGGGGGRASSFVLDVSLAQAESAQASTVAVEHKIIRNANLVIEIDSPSQALSRVTEAAESQGGFVVTSESKQNAGHPQSQPGEVVKVVIRVPSARFATALAGVRSIGGRVLQEDITGQDVTEEFLDVEARIRTKKALEAQFLEIMKQAKKVSEALEVQSELADVRTEIERLEGRRRFLENQASMSTITVTMQVPAPLVAANTLGFSGSLRSVVGEGLDITASIILGLIRLVVILIPVGLFILLPLGFLLRLLFKWFVAPKKAEALPVNAGNE